MFSRSNLLKTALFLSTLLMTTLASSAAVPTNETASSSVGSIHTYLMPDLSLKSVLSVPLGPQGEPNAVPPKFKGSCRCSCATNNCNTDADCGPGGACLAAPSCCAKSLAAQWFQDSEESSRKTELPAFKAKCN
jgi:hypothetical protein